MGEGLSKTEVKRRFKQTEEMAAELADLSDSDLKIFPGSDLLKTEIKFCRSQKGGSRKRQIKYVAKIMREEDLDSIYDFLSQRKGSKLREQRRQHEIEHIRDRLINEAIEFQQSLDMPTEFEESYPSSEIVALKDRCPTTNEQELRKIISSYVRSRSMQYYRELFRLVKTAFDQNDLAQRRL